MFKRQGTIILMLVLIGLLSFVFSSRALADLTNFYPASDEIPGTKLILNPEPGVVLNDADLELKLLTAQDVLTQRLAQLNVPQPYRVLLHNDELTVILPDNENISYVISVLAHVGEVKFIDGGAAVPPLGQRVKTGLITGEQEKVYRTLFAGPEIEKILPPDLANGQIFYQVTLNSDAAQRLTNFIETQPNHYICIAVDQEVISCSAMYHWAESTLQIIPNLSSGSLVGLADLPLFLESGPLPMSLEVQQR